MRFCPLFSGSSGNSTYIGTSQEGILIDAGKNCKQLSMMLDFIGVDKNISAIFITHEHSDHISALRVFAKKYGCKIFASSGTIKYLQKNGHLDGITDYFSIDSPVELNTMTVTPFETSHDASGSLGFSVFDEDSKITIISDTGIITNKIMNAANGSDLVMIESNHDVNMLRNGPYPYVLKTRILSGLGHLSNEQAADAVAELYRAGTRHFYLSHLSRENNLPRLALNTSLDALSALGAVRNADFTLDIAEEKRTEQGYITL